MVNTDLPRSTSYGRRSASAFRAAARVVLERDGFASARVADIAAEATRLAGPSGSWFDDGDHVAAVVSEHLLSALRSADRSPSAIVSAWWDACAAGSEAVGALVVFGGREWEDTRRELLGIVAVVVPDPARADVVTEAVVSATLRWLSVDGSPQRAEAVKILAGFLSAAV